MDKKEIAKLKKDLLTKKSHDIFTLTFSIAPFKSLRSTFAVGLAIDNSGS